MTHIAVISLAPGQVGFYDDLSGIHLSLANREAKVYKGTNTAGISNAIKEGKITVVSGSIGSETLVYQEAIKAIPTYYRLLEKKKKMLLKNKTARPVAEVKEEIKEENNNTEVIIEKEIKVKEEIEVEEMNIEISKEEVVEEVKKEKPKRKRKKKEVVEEIKED